jgi:hypothetical protein
VALAEQLQVRRLPMTAEERISIFREQFGENEFSRKNYLDFFKDISPPTGSRDLKAAVDKKIIKRKGDKRTAVYYFSK